MKWVTWMKCGNSEGALASFYFQGARFKKYFSAVRLPGPKSAIIKQAHEWAVSERERLGVKFSTYGPRSEMSWRKTNDLPVGVTIQYDRNNRFNAVAYTTINGRVSVRSWSFRKYGREGAIQRAINQRQEWETYLEKKLHRRNYGTRKTR